MSNRKYTEIKEGYWVYSIKIPSNNKYYIGVSKQKCYKRWQKIAYRSCSLYQYINEWDSLIKTVIKDGLTREEALKMEDDLIQALRFIDLCINEQRSGLIQANDRSAYCKELRKTNTEYRERENQRTKQWFVNNPEYMKQWIEDNKEHKKQLDKQYYENNKEKIKERQRQQRLKKKLEKTSLQQ